MAVDERRRHEMYLSLERALGREAADALMEHLPPVGWADVATKQDLESTKNAILAEMHRSLRNQALAMITVVGVLNGIVITALKLS